MKNDLENEVNERKDKKLQYHHGIELTTYNITPERLTHWAVWPVSESGVKLQYKRVQTRMRDDPTSVIGRYDILHVCR